MYDYYSGNADEALMFMLPDQNFQQGFEQEFQPMEPSPIYQVSQQPYSTVHTALCPDVPQSAVKQANKIVSKYNDYANKFVFMPNASHSNRYEPPSGFSFSVTPEAPLIATGLFNAERMFLGTSLLALPFNLKFKRGEPFTEDFIYANRDKIKQAISNLVFEDTNQNVQTIGSHAVEMSKLNPVLSCNSGDYAGLFSSSEKSGYKNVCRYWLGVQCSCKPESEKLVTAMEELQPQWDVSKNKPAKVTWEKFFFDPEGSKKVIASLKAIQQNRNKILNQLAQALEIDIPITQTSILTPTLETITNTVSQNNKTKNITYYSKCIDTTSITNGFIMNENPYLGPAILKGPPENGKTYGGKWTAPLEFNQAFPICTGRSLSTNEAKSKISKISEFDLHPFVSSSQTAISSNIRLVEGFYRTRNDTFRKAEKQLGYDHNWGEVSLKPLAVKISSHN